MGMHVGKKLGVRGESSESMGSIVSVISTVEEESFAVPQSVVIGGCSGVERSCRRRRHRWLQFLCAV